MNGRFDPAAGMLGGYQEYDGTIEFYGRVAALLKPGFTVLDLGAGRGAWFHDDASAYRRAIRDLRPRVARVIGVDVDPVVLTNPATTENHVMRDGRVPLPDQSVDVVVADYVLEHITDPAAFSAEIARLLRPGGFVCARTPHKYCYVSVAARLVRNRRHSAVLAVVQPGRKAEDVFPTAYRLNTLRDIGRHFSSYESYSYLYSCEPQYYFGRRWLYRVMRTMHRLLPTVATANLFVFLRDVRR